MAKTVHLCQRLIFTKEKFPAYLICLKMDSFKSCRNRWVKKCYLITFERDFGVKTLGISVSSEITKKVGHFLNVDEKCRRGCVLCRPSSEGFT